MVWFLGGLVWGSFIFSWVMVVGLFELYLYRGCSVRVGAGFFLVSR